MKNLKSFLFVALFLISVSASAQISWGVKAGFNASSLSGFEKFSQKFDELDGFSTSYKPGFHAGIVAQVGITENFFIQPELLYSLQGVAGKLEGEKDNLNLNFIQLPIYAGYKVNAGTNLNVIFGVGPYFAYGISGTEDVFDVFNRFDFGLGAIAGIEYSKVQITVGYDFGVTDFVNVDGWKTAKDILGLSSISNRTAKVSVAYFF